MYHRVSLINSFLKCIRRVWTVHGDGDGDDRLRHAAREKAHSMGVMLFGNPYPAVTKSNWTWWIISWLNQLISAQHMRKKKNLLVGNSICVQKGQLTGSNQSQAIALQISPCPLCFLAWTVEEQSQTASVILQWWHFRGLLVSRWSAHIGCFQQESHSRPPLLSLPLTSIWMSIASQTAVYLRSVSKWEHFSITRKNVYQRMKTMKEFISLFSTHEIQQWGGIHSWT